MITDIPTQEDFEQSGVAFLNLAWDSVLSLYLNLNLADVDDSTETEICERYWKSAQTTLATSLALVQQGAEFLLKGRIAAVSPFLLLSGEPREWPRHCDKGDLPFADFRTIDAQDLIRAHDTVSSNQLSDAFKTKFEQLRRLRNTTMHTVDRSSQVEAKDVMKEVLNICHYLVRPTCWVSLRREYLNNTPRSQINIRAEDVDYALAREIMQVVELLEPGLTELYLDFNKRQRRYYCMQCLSSCREYNFEPNLAQLYPNESSSTNIYCILCCQHQSVERRACRYPECLGNVIDAGEGVCLTCTRSQV